MYIDKEYTSALNTAQVAYPVGENKDSYTIVSWFKHNLLTNEITVKYELWKNYSYNEKREGVTYKEGVKFRELIFTGDYLKCVNIVKGIITIEGEWRYIPGTFNQQLEFTVK